MILNDKKPNLKVNNNSYATGDSCIVSKFSDFINSKTKVYVCKHSIRYFLKKFLTLHIDYVDSINIFQIIFTANAYNFGFNDTSFNHQNISFNDFIFSFYQNKILQKQKKENKFFEKKSNFEKALASFNITEKELDYLCSLKKELNSFS